MQRIGDRDHAFIKAIIAPLVAADKQDRRPPRVEGVEHPKGSATALNTSFARARVP